MAVIAMQCTAILLYLIMIAAGGLQPDRIKESDMLGVLSLPGSLLWTLRIVGLTSMVALAGHGAIAQNTPGIDPQVTEDPSEPAPSAPGKKQRVAVAKVTPRVDTRSGKTHFVEFRARSALSYGHTFAAFGRLNGRGQIETFEVAGLHPAGESTVPWSLGHIIAVPSETGPSDGDLEEQYITARFRIDLTEAEYRKLVVHIRKLQNNSPMWHAVLYNCSAFVSDIGKFMGLQAPNPLLFPADFINGMREMNVTRAAHRMPEDQRTDR
jgi:hypothetical protein